MTAQIPGTDRAHDNHDRLLVARFALGDDLAPDEAGAVRALLASCTECAALVGELQVVQHATAQSLAPHRPRDFFITAVQAQELRPNVWARFLGRLSAPRMGVLRPLAGATLAIGIVLVGTSVVVPRGDTVSDREPAPITANGTFIAPELVNGTGDAAGSSVAGSSPAADTRLAPQAKASPSVESMPAGSLDPRVMMMGGQASPGPGSTMTAYLVPQPTAGIDGQAQADLAVATSDAAVSAEPIGSALLLLGVVLAAVSALVLILAWLARRTTDPLLR